MTSLSRRTFVRTSAAAIGAIPFAVPTVWGSARADDRIKVGLIGCGGRGTGAAAQALAADSGVTLWAAADAFPDRLESCLGHLTRASEQPDGSVAAPPHADRVAVSEERRFVGLDCGERLIDEGECDVVLLCTPPHFRPMHLERAIAKGKHVFCEKPMAVDATGVRSVIESARRAEAQGLSLVSGFCWRYSSPMRAAIGKILAGDIGPVRSVHATYHTSPIWTHKRRPEWSEMTFQMRNWVHFLWLGGDHIVEQACHSADKIAWLMGDRPFARVTAMGGRVLRDGEEYGNAYDNFSVIYEYEDGARAFLTCRQIHHCSNENREWVACGEGVAFLNGWAPQETRLEGPSTWRYEGPDPNMYQVEHDELFRSIRSGRPLNDGSFMTLSTLMSIAGREAAYSGQTLSYERALASTQHLAPERYAFDAAPPPATVPLPGRYRFA